MGEYTPNGRFEFQNRCAEIKLRAAFQAASVHAERVGDGALDLSQPPRVAVQLEWLRNEPPLIWDSVCSAAVLGSGRGVFFGRFGLLAFFPVGGSLLDHAGYRLSLVLELLLSQG